MNNDDIIKLADDFQQSCDKLLKLAFIRKLPNGKYRVVSEKGKNLGTYDSKKDAEKRLKQVEYFKHLDNNNSDDIAIDLTDLEELTLSALLRKLRKKAPKECVSYFLKLYKKQFDLAIKKGLQKPESIAMQNALVAFNKQHKIKLSKNIVKNAAVVELGDPKIVGKYLSDIIKFLLMRISPERRPKSLYSLKRKIYSLNEIEMSNKKMPPSSSMGQSITLVKHILFNHDAKYIREVLNNIVRNL